MPYPKIDEPILIWGAGAIGGTIGAYLARAGIPVCLVDIVAEHVEACRTDGLAIEGPVDSFKMIVPAVTPDRVEGRYRRVILAVKAPATEAAIAALAPHLAEDGYILSAQNGLNEIAIAEAVGAERTIGCFLNFGADWLGPGRILFGNRSAMVIGELDGETRERTREIHALLRAFEPDAVITNDIWAYLWGKLSYGAMLFATALNMESMAANFADPARAKVWKTLGREVMAVAAARGVTPIGFAGFDPLPFAEGSEAERDRIIAWLADFNAKSAKTHSGIWRDLAVRKRRTEVNQQVGIVGRLGRESGIATPALDRLATLIGDIEEGRRPQSAETFEELAKICR